MHFASAVNRRVLRIALVLSLLSTLMIIPTSASAQSAGSGDATASPGHASFSRDCQNDPDVCALDGIVVVTFTKTGDPSCVFNATIDWDDGDIDQVPNFQNGQQVEHTFAVGFYTVDVTGNGSSPNPDVTCTFVPSSFTVEVPLIITPPIPPDAVKDVYSVSKNGQIRSDLLGNDDRGLCCEAPNRLPFNLVVRVTKGPDHGTVELDEPPGHVYEPEDPALFTYTPRSNFCGIDSFTYLIKPPDDDSGELADTAKAIILVCPGSLTAKLAEMAKDLPLTRNERRAALALLNQAQRAFNQEKLGVAITKLEAFIRKVKRSTGDSPKRRALIRVAEKLIEDAKGR